MRRRKLRWTAAVLAVLSLACGAFVLWPRAFEPSRITEENFDRINPSTSPAVLFELLGPPGDYSTGPTIQLYEVNPYLNIRNGWVLVPTRTGSWRGHIEAFAPEALSRGETAWTWSNDTSQITIVAGPNALTCKSFSRVWRVEQGPLDNLLWRAERLWKKWFPE